MTDLHEIAESAAVCTDEQIANAYREIRCPKAPDTQPDPKRAETVENVSLAIGLATVAGVLAGVLS